MFYISRKKSACLAGLLMISGAAMAADPVAEAKPESTQAAPAPAVPVAPAAKEAPVVTESAAQAPTPTPAPTAEKPAAAVVNEAPAPEATLPTATATVTESAKETATPEINLDSEEQKRSYASGVALAHYIENQLAQQNSLHITLDKNIMLAGIADTFNAKGKMSEQDVQNTMAVFDEQIKALMQAETNKKLAEDKAFVDEFAKRPGVKKTSKGLYYLIEEKGDGAAIKDTNQVEIAYKGELSDGSVVDGPKVENANEIFRVANMPPILRDSVKLLRKGGRIKVVIPPAAVESNKDTNKPNVVVIYTISVVNVNNP